MERRKKPYCVQHLSIIIINKNEEDGKKITNKKWKYKY